ncbi:MAG: tetratricopeptide repeat protein [Verrucomicrobia bacterium]|nr:tetratricopeptide repeat protein [Verrucomicrobiota bacterium]
MPEKKLAQIPRVLREQHEKGLAALQRNNFDYAISLLGVVVEKEPACFESREALRAAQLRKAGGATSFFRKMLGSANPMLAKGQLALRSNPLEALKIAEHILTGDPYNNGAHKLLADAALAADFPKTAALSLEIVLKNNPKDREVTLKYGSALAQAGQVEKAEALITELLRANPADPEIAQALKNLSASRTMQEGGYEAAADGKGSFRDMLRDKEEAVSLEQENRQVKEGDVADKLIREHEARLSSEPGNLKLLRSLAELYSQKKDFDKALEYYQKIASPEGGADASLERAIAETTTKKFEQARAALDPNALDYADQSARIQAERQAYQITECRNRAERYPNDLQIRFELGQLYFNAGKISEAIQEFQKAQANPHRRIQALSYLGQCFARRGMNDLAARTLQNAIKEKVGFDDERKELIYALGAVFEKMGKREEAIEQFKLIYETDIGYKDVAAKVDAYYASQ